jgi:hypothetical protein
VYISVPRVNIGGYFVIVNFSKTRALYDLIKNKVLETGKFEDALVKTNDGK